MMPNNRSHDEYSSLLDAEIVVEAQAALLQQKKDDEYGIRATKSAAKEAVPTKDPGTQRQMTGAAVAGGLAGFCLVGPVVALVAAGGAAVMATSRGTAGDVARASGDLMASAGDRLKKMDQKHHVVDKTSRGVVNGCHWVSHKLQVKPRPETQLTI